MLVHHWVTVLLLVTAKVCGYQQFGATVLLCTDNCDLLMPLAKLAEYTGHRRLQMLFTLAFCVLWIPLRIGVFGYKVLWSIAVDSYVAHLRPFACHWLCFAGLTVIYLLQWYWTRYLLEMVWKKLMTGKGVVDVRSDDDSASSKKQQ